MDLSSTMRFVMSYARVEVSVSGMEEMLPEHVFLGLLKLSGMAADKIPAASGDAQLIAHDIQKVAQLFQKIGIHPEEGREKLRRRLYNETSKKKGTDLIAEWFDKAADKLGNKALWAADVLTVFMREPTPLIRSAFFLKRNSSKLEIKEPEMELTAATQKGDDIRSLTEFTGRIRKMRQTLLGRIFGQDHAIHAFAEGMFNAEMLAGVDEKRKQPRAVFVFAGPPGVGKTFLAEQAAGELSIPFKRFDMSAFSDHQAHSNLIGFAPSYKDARPGLLSGFVHDNPHSILLFDEIEKAHLNTIQLFLQVLDAGNLHDDFLDKTISFKDTIIIFTTNAGRSLYESEPRKPAAGFSRKTILNALETDVHPQTGDLFFPATICSRLATGYPVMFNHLQAYDLEKISAAEFLHSCVLFEQKYRLKATVDPLISTALLLSEGGWVDARAMKAQTGLFFKNEIFKLFSFLDNHQKAALKKIKSIHFKLPTKDVTPAIKQLFESPSRPELLLFGSASFAEKLQKTAPDVIVHATSDVDEALRITAERDMSVVFLGDVPLLKMRSFFNLLRKRVPDMSIYLLVPDTISADQEQLSAFIRAGARSVLTLPKKKSDTFADEIALIMRQTHRQNVAAGFALQHKMLVFETSVTLSANKAQAIVQPENFSIRRAIQAEDNHLILDEIEKPEIRFEDVIGVDKVKDELSLFVDYLKNPRRFAALGLKPPKGVLLYGPSGTGKTLLAKAMAGESDATFIPASANALVAGYQHQGANPIRDLFNRARRYSPAILFIDEIEAIGRCMAGFTVGDCEKIALKTLLAEMENVPADIKRPVFVLAATNFELEDHKNGMDSETIDTTLVRRFSRKIRIGLPDKNNRKRYLRLILDKHRNHQISDHLIEYLADRSDDFSLADLEAVLDLAFRIAAQKNSPLTNNLLEDAFNSSHPGEKKYWDNEYWKK